MKTRIVILLNIVISANSAVFREVGNELEGEFADSGIRIMRQTGGLCLEEHNSARAANGLAPLTYDNNLEAAAAGHNEKMTSQNCFNHQCPNEAELEGRISQTGFKWSGIAENIAAGDTDCQSVMNTWMNSPGHKANILGNYKSVGCVVNQCASCQFKDYWTCDFGTSQ